MLQHRQLFLHEPERRSFGDCHRTALACLLNLPPEEVPPQPIPDPAPTPPVEATPVPETQPGGTAPAEETKPSEA